VVDQVYQPTGDEVSYIEVYEEISYIEAYEKMRRGALYMFLAPLLLLIIGSILLVLVFVFNITPPGLKSP
jgi:hypothetical protein